MSPLFTGVQIRQMQQAQRVLLSVQTAESVESWTTEVFKVLRPLLNTDHLYYLQPEQVSHSVSDAADMESGRSGSPAQPLSDTFTPDGSTGRNGSSSGAGAVDDGHSSLIVRAPSLGEDFAAGINRHFIGFEDGFSIFREAYPTTMHRLVRAAGAGAVHDAPLYDAKRRRQLDLYQEVFRPVRVVRQLALAKPLPQGEALLIAGFDEPEAPEYNGTRHQILQILAPIFETSLKLLWQSQQASRRFTTMIDALPEALIVFDADGGERYRNRAFEALPAGEADRAVLVRAAGKLVDEVGRCLRPMRSSTPLTTSSDISLPSGSYNLRAFVAPSMTDRPGILVWIEPDALLPPPGRLQSVYGLTPRQAEVALLMAEGLSDRSIAERLAISRHTAHRHAEKVLKKMNLSSRAGVALACVKASRSG